MHTHHQMHLTIFLYQIIRRKLHQFPDGTQIPPAAVTAFDKRLHWHFALVNSRSLIWLFFMYTIVRHHFLYTYRLNTANQCFICICMRLCINNNYNSAASSLQLSALFHVISLLTCETPTCFLLIARTLNFQHKSVSMMCSMMCCVIDHWVCIILIYSQAFLILYDFKYAFCRSIHIV
jgi:hypothetical protein